jgi:L-asparagine permease
MTTEFIKATPAEREVFTEEDRGYHKALKPRQIQMIAIGGAIGTGLFLGAGGRLAQAGPSLVFVYAVCGFFRISGAARTWRADYASPKLRLFRLLCP